MPSASPACGIEDRNDVDEFVGEGGISHAA
jgi:hypothetical protein